MTHPSSPSHNKTPSWFHYTNTTKRLPMKRLSSSDSLIPICPSGDEKGLAYEELGDEEFLCYVGGGGAGEKKRRLSVDQVRALEKNFEVENKLEPERKTKLAQELGLQPRQVAVWFQNRRARWKTKQLERDYKVLKDTYDALLVDHDVILRDKEALLAEIKELKAKLANESPNPAYSSIKEEENNKASEEPPAPTYKDRSSDSDSSAVLNDVLNDENSPHEVAAAMAFESSPLFPTSSHKGVFIYQHQPQLMEVVEDEGFIGGDESCSSFFFDEQVTSSLPWYYSEQWN